MLEPILGHKKRAPIDTSLILDISARSGTIKDANGRTITNSGVTRSTAVMHDGNPSMYFDGTQYFTVPNVDNSLWLAGPFCIDFWYYLISRVAPFPTFMGNYDTWPAANGLQLFAGHSSSGTDRYSVAMASGFPVINGPAIIAYGSWHHYSIERTANNVITNYIDGFANGNVTSALSLFGTKSKISFGAPSDNLGGGGLKGYIDRIRIQNGSRFNGPFTPPLF